MRAPERASASGLAKSRRGLSRQVKVEQKEGGSRFIVDAEVSESAKYANCLKALMKIRGDKSDFLSRFQTNVQ